MTGRPFFFQEAALSPGWCAQYSALPGSYPHAASSAAEAAGRSIPSSQSKMASSPRPYQTRVISRSTPCSSAQARIRYSIYSKKAHCFSTAGII